MATRMCNPASVENGDYWKNGFDDLRCPYSGPNSNDHWGLIWSNSSCGYEVELLSHICLNGSLSYLGREKWNERCFPNYGENLVWRRLAGVWSLFNFFVGLLGNLLTLVAVPYATWKRR